MCALGWPTKADGGHRTIHQTFLALGGTYRHADVYRAMQERRELERDAMKCWRARGELALAATRLADPNTTVTQALADEKKLEAHLVAPYIATAVSRGSRTRSGGAGARTSSRTSTTSVAG